MSLTNNDLQQIGSVVDERLDKKLKPIQKSLKVLKTTLDLHVRDTDRLLNFHHRRLTKLEEKVGIQPPPYIPKVN